MIATTAAPTATPTATSISTAKATTTPATTTANKVLILLTVETLKFSKDVIKRYLLYIISIAYIH
jgi:hypothetical protein